MQQLYKELWQHIQADDMIFVGFRSVSPMSAALRTDVASGQTEIMVVARACAGR